MICIEIKADSEFSSLRLPGGSVQLDELTPTIQHSIRVLKSANASGTDNPTILVHELVEYLQGLSKNNT
ncbi:MAG: hypothetical protein L3J89_02055 [Gammaproteobacteria bacterium]|nr:hypothetical protein [Gammaproteobacteria bacterium]